MRYVTAVKLFSNYQLYRFKPWQMAVNKLWEFTVQIYGFYLSVISDMKAANHGYVQVMFFGSCFAKLMDLASKNRACEIGACRAKGERGAGLRTSRAFLGLVCIAHSQGRRASWRRRSSDSALSSTGPNCSRSSRDWHECANSRASAVAKPAFYLAAITPPEVITPLVSSRLQFNLPPTPENEMNFVSSFSFVTAN